ncbi:recombinase family protein [Collimonas antrihumi]|uniref:recombinase family protein n=1 Tax=Collimonas antrihumi TaxID=1940615 RepID=UPI003CCE685C
MPAVGSCVKLFYLESNIVILCQTFLFADNLADGVVEGNLEDLRRIVQTLTQRGVHIEFVKEHLSFTGEDSPMANLMLSVMGAFAKFERSLTHERQRESIALAKQRGAYRGRKKSLTDLEIAGLRQRAAAGEQKNHSLVNSASVGKRCTNICGRRSSACHADRSLRSRQTKGWYQPRLALVCFRL